MPSRATGVLAEVERQWRMALALALLSLLMMTALLLPLLSMSSSEVQIAANLTAAAQARQCAEAGLEYALSEMNVPGGAPFLSSTIQVNGNVVCTFLVTPATVSPTEVALTSTSTLATVRPGSSTASQNFVLDLSTGRWSAKPGTFRGR
jgi:septal ring-binding cell division protein DamX